MECGTVKAFKRKFMVFVHGKRCSPRINHICPDFCQCVKHLSWERQNYVITPVQIFLYFTVHVLWNILGALSNYYSYLERKKEYSLTWGPCVNCMSWPIVSFTWPCCGLVGCDDATGDCPGDMVLDWGDGAATARCAALACTDAEGGVDPDLLFPVGLKACWDCPAKGSFFPS